MPLEPVQLDDLTWSDLTTAARGRIAGVSNGQWTLHAPVDPGITLLELFAAQLEQRLYWMDQPSGQSRTAMLSLLGIQPRPVSVAGTVFCLIHQDREAAGALAAGAVIEQITDESPRRFTTDQTTQLLPIQWRIDPAARRARRSRVGQPCDVDVRLKVGSEDRSHELQTQRLPCLLPADGVLRETRIAFRLQGIPAGTDPISLFIELDAPDTIRAQWLPEQANDEVEKLRQEILELRTDSHLASLDDKKKNDARIDERLSKIEVFGNLAAPARLSWHYGYVTAENPFQDSVSLHTFSDIDDGTNGFRRSGIIRFDAPSIDADSLAKLNPSNALWLVLVVQAASASYAFLPRVRQILPNAVIGRHRVRYGLPEDDSRLEQVPNLRDQIVSWRRLPGNRLQLPLAAGELPIPASVKFQLCEVRDGKETFFQWCPTSDFSRHGPSDRRFVVDRQRRTLLFGDGLNGRLPIPSKNNNGKTLFHLAFDVGGGTAGNTSANQRWRIIRDGGSAWSVINVVAAQGGEEAESLDEAVRRSRSELRRPSRAVTKDDIEQLARQTPAVGMKRAHASVGFHPQHPCVPTPGAVTVFIVPDLPPSLRRFRERSCGDDLIALRPDPGALRAVFQRLNAARLVTHEIFVCPPVYEPIGLSVVISGTPVDPGSARESATQALHEYLHPLYGGPEGDGWPFGYPLRPSELVRVLREAIDQELQVQEVGIRILKPDDDAALPRRRAGTTCCADGSHRRTENTPRFEACSDVDIRANALVAMRSVQISFIPPRARTGGLS